MSVESSLPGLQTAIFSLYLHMMWGERESIFLVTFLIWTLIPIMRVPPKGSTSLPKALLPHTVILGIQISTYEIFGGLGGGRKHSVHSRHQSL